MKEMLGQKKIFEHATDKHFLNLIKIYTYTVFNQTKTRENTKKNYT